MHVTGRARDERGATLVEATFVTPLFVVLIFAIIEFSGYISARSSTDAALKAGSRQATIQGDNEMAEARILHAMTRESAGLSSSNDKITKIKIWNASNGRTTEPDDSVCFTLGDPVHGTYDDCNYYSGSTQDEDANRGVAEALRRAALPYVDPESGETISAANSNWWFGCNPDTTSDIEAFKPQHKYDCGWPPAAARATGDPYRNTFITKPGTKDCGGGDCLETDLVGISITVRHQAYTGLFMKEVTYTMTSVTAMEPRGYRS